MSRPFAAAAPLDDIDSALLEEILLRLPPQPSSLPRASLVCTRWLHLLSDPGFLGRFRKHHHHQNKPPPLLGFFDKEFHSDRPPIFNPTMGQRDRIPAARFSSPWSRGEGWKFHGCRHGLALLTCWMRCEAVVWDPLTGHQRRVTFPPGFSLEVQTAAVMCTAAAQDGHVHGDCRFTPFRLALVGTGSNSTHLFACLYDSESGVWGDIVSLETQQSICTTSASVLVGDAFCWLLSSSGVLQFDFQSQSLAVIQKPAEAHPNYYSSLFVVRTEHGGLGLAVSNSEYLRQIIQLWERKSNCDGVVRWELQKTIELNEILSQQPTMERHYAVRIQGYDEDTNAIFLSSFFGDHMLQLESTQFTTLFEIERSCISGRSYYPYRNFYIAGSRVGGQDGGAEM